MKKVDARHGAPDRAAIVRAVTEIYRGPSWLGPSVRHAVRQLTPERALYRPAPGRNTGWELLLHLSAARHILLARLAGTTPGPFPRKRRATWWVLQPERPDAAQWKADVALLEDYQRRLLAAVETAPARRFAQTRPGGRWTIGEELLGIAFHDAYHAGQIMLLARLAGRGAREGG